MNHQSGWGKSVPLQGRKERKSIEFCCLEQVKYSSLSFFKPLIRMNVFVLNWSLQHWRTRLLLWGNHFYFPEGVIRQAELNGRASFAAVLGFPLSKLLHYSLRISTLQKQYFFSPHSSFLTGCEIKQPV